MGEHPVPSLAWTREASQPGMASWQEGLGTQTTSSPHPPDRDECSGGSSACSHSCHNGPGHFSCSCPAGFALAGDDRSCRGEWGPGGEALCGPGPRVCRGFWGEGSGQGTYMQELAWF